MDKIILFAAMIALSGCLPKGQFCDVSKPYFFTDEAEADATPAPVKRFIVGHDDLGAALCNWTPPKK